jgi:tRNA(fMet)-specific endonuclease VapC
VLVLDTDLLTIIQRQEGAEYERLVSRLRPLVETEPVAITVVSLEEQMRGWLAFLNANPEKRSGALVVGYRRFHALFQDYGQRLVLDYTDAADMTYLDLKAKKTRVPTMDLRIAAIVLANDATLLTRNARDFQKVPGLKVEDWSKG